MSIGADHPLYRDTITIVDRVLVGEDDRGNDRFDETERVIEGVNLQPASSVEVVDGRDQVVTRWRLAGPGDLGLTAYSRVKHGARLFELDGECAVFGSFGGLLDHTEALLMEVTG